MADEVQIDGNSLTLEELHRVAGQGARVTLAPEAIERIRQSRKVIEDILQSDRVVYGVNTGFGRLSEVRIPPDHVEELQLNLIRSHAAGVGEPFSENVTRAIMLLRANVLAKGHSGVRTEVVRLLLDMLNHRIHPVIPSKGSVGASGDLAPLAHLALSLIGEDKVVSAALQQSGLTPITLQAKEGIALINGTQAMTGVGALAAMEALQLCKVADVAGALTLDAMRGTDTAFDERIVGVRPHAGAVEAARNLRDLMRGSSIRESHRDSTHKVQDHYSLRCMPQVHGAVRDALRVAEQWLAIEINAGTDNPLVFSKDHELLSGGNFHGAPMALLFDFLSVATAQLANISERRTALLVDSNESGLPPFLSPDPGLNSGFMIAQVTAAALVSENKVLAHPASVDSIPTSANKEDHVSMGVTAAVKFSQIVRNAANVLAIELLCAAQAIDFLKPLTTSAALGTGVDQIRARVPHMEKDRVLSADINSITALIRSDFLAPIERVLKHSL